MNALAYNEQTGLVDLFGGLEDMRQGIIRCVGDPAARFTEDALRIMRAVRFSAQLGYEIEQETRDAIVELAPNLSRISAERIQAELVKLVVSGHPEYLRTAWETGVTAVILPEFDRMMETEQNNPHHFCSVGEHTLYSMEQVEATRELRLAMLFHDIGKPACFTVGADGIAHFYQHEAVSADMSRNILRRLKFDNDLINTVCKLVRFHDYGNGVMPDRRIVRRAMNKIGEKFFPMLFQVKKADIMAQSEIFRQEKLECLARWQQLYEEIVAEHECVSLKTLALSGKDLIALGMKPGRELGGVLDAMLEMVLDEPECNIKEVLTAWVQEHYLQRR